MINVYNIWNFFLQTSCLTLCSWLALVTCFQFCGCGNLCNQSCSFDLTCIVWVGVGFSHWLRKLPPIDHYKVKVSFEMRSFLHQSLGSSQWESKNWKIMFPRGSPEFVWAFTCTIIKDFTRSIHFLNCCFKFPIWHCVIGWHCWLASSLLAADLAILSQDIVAFICHSLVSMSLFCKTGILTGSWSCHMFPVRVYSEMFQFLLKHVDISL